MGALPFPTPDQVKTWGRETAFGIDVIGEPVMVWVAGAAGFDKLGPISAVVRAYRADELVPGGPIEVGDWRAIVNAATFAQLNVGRRLERKDRIEWRGRQYAVQQFDDATRSASGEVFAIEMQLRG